jgi:hypothetical protein
MNTEMNSIWIVRCMLLLEDARNSENDFGINQAYIWLRRSLEHRDMFTEKDYITFKNKWYENLKNKSY